MQENFNQKINDAINKYEVLFLQNNNKKELLTLNIDAINHLIEEEKNKLLVNLLPDLKKDTLKKVNESFKSLNLKFTKGFPILDDKLNISDLRIKISQDEKFSDFYTDSLIYYLNERKNKLEEIVVANNLSKLFATRLDLLKRSREMYNTFLPRDFNKKVFIVPTGEYNFADNGLNLTEIKTKRKESTFFVSNDVFELIFWNSHNNTDNVSSQYFRDNFISILISDSESITILFDDIL